VMSAARPTVAPEKPRGLTPTIVTTERPMRRRSPITRGSR
jgi:hypothetical protein